jgi:Flp pilus assembly pilin Flp
MKKITLLVLFLPILSFGQWTQIGIDIDGEAANDNSGISVHLSSDGTVVAIGAEGNDGNGTDSGHVRVYKNIAGVWTQIGADINGEAAGDVSGKYISINSDGSIVAIGARVNDGNGTDSGHVRVYKNIAGVWTQIGADINGEAAGDLSGCSVSLNSDGSIVAIGAIFNDGNGSASGHVRVYKNISNVWTLIGADINGEAAGDFSGYTVELSSDGSIVAIGAIGNNSTTGHVRVYKNIANVWTQVGSDINGEAAGDYSGTGVSLSSDGSIVAIAAIFNDGNGTDSGHVRIFKNISGFWTQIGNDINGENSNDYCGSSVNLSSDGTVIAVGAGGNDGNGTDSGHVRVYKNIAGNWSQIGADINGEAADDISGDYSVGLNADGTILAIGAFRNDGNGNNSGHVRVFYEASLSISDNDFAKKIILYPNPSFGVSKIQLNNTYNLITVRIFDVLGKQIDSKEYTDTNEITLDIQDYSKGIYIVKVKSDSNQATLKWIIK